MLSAWHSAPTATNQKQPNQIESHEWKATIFFLYTFIATSLFESSIIFPRVFTYVFVVFGLCLFECKQQKQQNREQEYTKNGPEKRIVNESHSRMEGTQYICACRS